MAKVTKSTGELVLDLGASHVAAARWQRSKSGDLTLIESSRESWMQDTPDEASWFAALAATLPKVLPAGRSARDVVRVSLSGAWVLCKTIQVPAVATAQRAHAIAMEAGQQIPYPLEEVAWGYAIQQEQAMGMEVLLAAVRASILEGVRALLAAHGLKPGLITPAAVTLAGCPEVPAAGVTVVVDVGARSTDFCLVVGSRVVVRTINFGGSSLTSHIAKELGNDFTSAEKLKIAVLRGQVSLPPESPAQRAVDGASRNFLNRLRLELNRSRAYFQAEAGETEISQVILTGASGDVPGLRSLVGQVWREATMAESPVDAPDLVLVGLPRLDPSHLNLISGAQRRAESQGKRQPVLLAAAVLFALGCLGLGWHAHAEVAALDAETKLVERALQPIRQRQFQLEEDGRALATLAADNAAWSAVLAERTFWGRLLADVEIRTLGIEDAWLDGFVPERARLSPDGKTVLPQRIAVQGRLLDRSGAPASDRVRRLFTAYRGSAFLAEIENERFDQTQPGILRFEAMLVLRPVLVKEEVQP